LLYTSTTAVNYNIFQYSCTCSAHSLRNGSAYSHSDTIPYSAHIPYTAHIPCAAHIPRSAHFRTALTFRTVLTYHAALTFRNAHIPCSAYIPCGAHIPCSTHTLHSAHTPCSVHIPYSPHIFVHFIFYFIFPYSAHIPCGAHIPCSAHIPCGAHIPCSAHIPLTLIPSTRFSCRLPVCFRLAPVCSQCRVGQCGFCFGDVRVGSGCRVFVGDVFVFNLLYLPQHSIVCCVEPFCDNCVCVVRSCCSNACKELLIKLYASICF
jgi:hypothetical protein